VSSNLSIALAEAGYSVILMDADMRLPRIHSVFQLPATPGLSEVLTGEVPPEEALSHTPWPNLRVMTSGQLSNEMTGLVSASRMRMLFRHLCGMADYVIVDTPSVLSTAYTTLLAKHATAVVLVVAQRYTERASFRMALQQLSEVQTKVVGIVVNRSTRTRADAYYPRQSLASRVRAR
jgi:non-specific protein-tyrosine kinase